MTRKERKYFWLQFTAAIVASVTAAGYGSILSWTSPALPFLETKKSNLHLSKDQISWIAPLLPIGLMIGNFLNPLYVDRIGRKWTLLVFAIPQIISWLFILLTKNYIVIYIARILGGIGYGSGICAVTIYLSEIGNRKTRGTFIAFVKFSTSVGILFTMVLGAALPYFYMNLGHLIVPILFVLTFFFLPDSSYFLEINNQEEQMKLNLFKLEEADEEKAKLNGNYIATEVPLCKEDSALKEDLNPKKVSVKLKESSFWKLFSLSGNLRALAIIFLLNAHDGLSGHISLRYFTQEMLTHEGSFLQADKAAVGLAIVKLLASVIATQVIERMQRRTLFFSSGIVASLADAMVGIFFYLEESKINVSSINFFPFLGLIIYEFAVTVGTSNLFYVYLGEFFSHDVKGMAVTYGKIIHMIFGFLSALFYQILHDSVCPSVIFFIFSICGAVITCITVLITPETRGKSLKDIQLLLQKKPFF
ncbi:facilitated trehalose transporter Tret1-like [Belonocnema kinseyi]|uniref:facilitated trehalose transporter Tret1-like n=1 Tax=Belonocnema kinseyi TaxID=2817044 RepID=UPI00143D4E4D|nr:facilitated trehalose transporter Tret1-like [Belonocnema kinseyi]